MITYYATSPHLYTMREYLTWWAPDLADRVHLVGYSELDLRRPPTPGLHVLTDFERLLPPELMLARRLHRTLADRPGVRVIGDPGTWSDRHTLLARLHAEGINDFRAYRIDELGPQVRFPVFLRWANEHGGSLGDPVPDRVTLDARLARIKHDHHRRWRWIRDQLLVVEQVDAVSPDGLYRKYSAARIGDTYIPRHLLVDQHWITKNPKVVTTELLAEEEAFLAEPKDLDLMRRAFEIAGIEYGRIDWGYVNGRPQIWEINTNPMFVTGSSPHPLRVELLRRQALRGREALLAAIPVAGDAPARTSPYLRPPERWAWDAVNRGSRRWDARRR